MRPHRNISLPTKCVITIDKTHLENSFDVPDESKPFSTYDTKHLFCIQSEKRQLKQPSLKLNQKKWNSSSNVIHKSTLNSESTNSSEQRKNEFNKTMLINVIKVRAIKKNSKGVNKRKNKITCQCIVF